MSTNSIAIDNQDPIIAQATPSGKGGIGVIRISFGRASPLANDFIKTLINQNLSPRHALYTPFYSENGDVLDKGIALYFPAPYSYTGESVLELQGHGGPIVQQLIMRACLSAGRLINLRIAQPGEFTQRAFFNNKIDLAQAEAVADLIEANTEAAARSASRSLDGAFSRTIVSLVDQLVMLRILVEASMDFPEEEIDHLQAGDASGQLNIIKKTLEDVLLRAQQGVLLRDGLTVVLSGRPNAGKSSLLNALAGIECAIVTAIAGTTRDKIQQSIQINGIPIHIVDTAGLRQTSDEIELIGITKTWEAIKNADVILHMIDASAIVANDLAQDKAIADKLPNHLPIIRVINKIDIHQPTHTKQLFYSHFKNNEGDKVVEISAKTGAGIDQLRRTLIETAGASFEKTNESQDIFVARERHLEQLRITAKHLDDAKLYSSRIESIELFAEHLRLAQQALSEITGEFTNENLLGAIFSRFCIGK